MPVSPAARFHAAMVLTGIAFGFTAPLTTVYAEGLGAGPFLAGVAVSSISVFLLVIDVFGTRWTPRLPPRGALSAGLVVFGVGSLAGAAAPDLRTVIAARVLQGAGVGVFLGVGPQLAVRLAGRANAGRALGTFNAAWFAGIAAGPLLGGWVSGAAPGVTGLRVSFVVCGLLSMAIGAVLPLIIPGRPVTARPRWGLPTGVVPFERRSVAVLTSSALGQVVRSGVAMTLVPLVGTGLGLPRATLGVGLSMLATADVVAMYTMPRATARFGVLPALTAVCVWGAAVSLCLTLTSGTTAYLTLATLLGLAVGSAGLGPAELAVDLAESAEDSLAAYRIAGDAGLAVGGPALGGAVLVLGAGTALLVASLVFLAVAGSAALAGPGRRRRTVAVGDLIPTPLKTRPAVRPTFVTHETGVAMTPLPEVADGSPPSADLFDAILDDQGMTYLSAERRTAALQAHRTMRPSLERLRARPMPFLDAPEPGAGGRWIESGGAA